MINWIILLVVIVIILGYTQSRKLKNGKKDENSEIGGCGSSCAGCANRSMCHPDENNEKK